MPHDIDLVEGEDHQFTDPLMKDLDSWLDKVLEIEPRDLSIPATAWNIVGKYVQRFHPSKLWRDIKASPLWSQFSER